MRVISGSAKGRQLKVPKATTTRPMTDLVKGALFSMLMPYGIEDRRVLDLYAGSGSIGIEALSRGAASAVFVEQNAGVCAITTANLEHTRFSDRARVHQAKVTTFLSRLEARTATPEETFDLIFMDPPYAAPDITDIMTMVATSPILAPDALLVVGHSVRVALPDTIGPLIRERHRCHGDSCFSIYVMDQPPNGPTAPPAEKEEL